jgi:hypothetical protein
MMDMSLRKKNGFQAFDCLGSGWWWEGKSEHLFFETKFGIGMGLG